MTTKQASPAAQTDVERARECILTTINPHQEEEDGQDTFASTLWDDEIEVLAAAVAELLAEVRESCAKIAVDMSDEFIHASKQPDMRKELARKAAYHGVIIRQVASSIRASGSSK